MASNEVDVNVQLKMLVAKIDAMQKQLTKLEELLKENQKTVQQMGNQPMPTHLKKSEGPQTVTAGSTVIVRM